MFFETKELKIVLGRHRLRLPADECVRLRPAIPASLAFEAGCKLGHNENPKPFIGTAKAIDILEKVKNEPGDH
jgi:hypothetical protein